ncbi:MAG TPA: PQQ-dependent sugar dehydrogenase, partial [Chitinophagaceae bacterium]|nr:PQQ-dependent sugar dehydrogenase [Chitinophagaceae bacterium]
MSTVVGATRDGATIVCSGTAKYDVWYKFTAQSPNPTITLTGIGSNFASPGLQVLNGCGGTVMACGGTSVTPINLVVGTVYLIRIMSTGAATAPTTAGGFTICLLDAPPANDDCSNARTITTATACSAGTSQLVNQSLYGATVAGAGIASSCGSQTSPDVWYKFVANSVYPSITVSNPGTSWSGALRFQLFSSTGPCAGLSQVACSNSSISMATNQTPLVVGNTYYIRIHKNNLTTPGTSFASWKFDICVTDPAPVDGEGSRMREVFKQSLLSPPNILNDPWEICYGPDTALWITESRGYKVYRMNPVTGEKTTVLDISQGSGFLSDPSFDLQFDFNGQGNPQGGLAGLAIHPDFNAGKKFVYISYIHKYITTVTSPANGGVIFRNQIVKFTYDPITKKLGSPETLCDTLPGSSDHNSQRMIIAPVGNTYYLFYAQGDMGAGQFGNAYRPNHAQDTAYYEGKILRFNLETDGDAGLDKWIPFDNPFNNYRSSGRQSAVWVTGIRNNQGFAYVKINGVPYMYGSSHGPFSDDEVNIIEKSMNYGHPRVIGYSSDHNYDQAKAGGSASALPLIYNELKYATDTIGSGYRDPIYTFYSAPKGNTGMVNSIQYIYNQVNNNNNDNSQWPSLAPSGMEAYTNSLIPGWKNSLLVGSLKGGRVIRLKLKADGSGIVPPGPAVDKIDTINYFRSINRFRDVAIAPDGKTIYIVIDKSSTTSGPTTTNPINSACAGCVQKYTFLGYNVNTGSGNRSYIPNTIDIAAGKTGIFETANKVVINAANGNNNIWVPITDTNSNILAEINAQGLYLDTVTTTLYSRTGSSRIQSGKKYLNRNITISPQHQPGGTVLIRLYISK